MNDRLATERVAAYHVFAWESEKLDEYISDEAYARQRFADGVRDEPTLSWRLYALWEDSETEEFTDEECLEAYDPSEDWDAALVQAVKTHALANYTKGGWDVVVECWEDEAIEKVLREDGATTVEQAIASFQPLVDVWADRQADAKNSAF